MLQFARFTLVRAIMACFTLLLVSLIVFSLMELVPGDCAERYMAFKNTQGLQITTEDIDAERVRLGLDKPFIVRWTTWVGNAFQGEFGDSCILRVNINSLLGDKFWISLAHLHHLAHSRLCDRRARRHNLGDGQQPAFSTTRSAWSAISGLHFRIFSWRS